MRRRRVILRAGLAAATVGLAGCGSEGGTEGADEAAQSTATGTDTAATGTPTTATGLGTAPPADRTVVGDPDGTPPVQTATDDGGDIEGAFDIRSAFGTNIQSRRVRVVRLRLAAAPGATVDTGTIRVRWVAPDGTYFVVANTDGRDTDGYFGVNALVDENDSAPLLDDPNDVIELVFDLGSDDVPVDDPQPGAARPGSTSFGSVLRGGAVVSVQLATGAGRSVTRRLEVPTGLGGLGRVELGVS